jgi:hypothetical protein
VLNQMKTHLVSLFRFRLVTVISNVQVKLNFDLSFSMFNVNQFFPELRTKFPKNVISI